MHPSFTLAVAYPKPQKTPVRKSSCSVPTPWNHPLCNFFHKIAAVKLGNIVRFREGYLPSVNALNFIEDLGVSDPTESSWEFMSKTGWHWKLGARATGLFRSAMNEVWGIWFCRGPTSTPNLKQFYKSDLVPAILYKMMLINNLSDSNFIEIVKLKMLRRLWFNRCIFKKRVNVSRFITFYHYKITHTNTFT